MNFKKIGIITAVVAVTFGLVIPLFLPDAYQIERSVTINSPRNLIFSHLVDLSSWQKWSPWYAMEPTAEFKFEGTPGVVGSRSIWSGKKIGSGQQTLVKVVQPEYIETALEFNGNSDDAAIGYFKLVESDDGAKVIWGLKGNLSYPLGRYFGLLMDSFMGKDFETGLNSLKNLIEKEN